MITIQQVRNDIFRMRHDSRWKMVVPEFNGPNGLIETLLEEGLSGVANPWRRAWETQVEE